LLIDYGFVAEPVNAETSLRFSVSGDDINLYEKESVLEGAGLSTSQSFILSEADPLPVRGHATSTINATFTTLSLLSTYP